MRVIIAGSRTLTDIKHVFHAVEQSGFEIDEIISGMASGVDQNGEFYAQEKGIKLTRIPAEWMVHGKRAGYIRNEKMAEYAGATDKLGGLILIWDGESRGSMHMRDIAIRMGLRVFVYQPEAFLKIDIYQRFEPQ